MKRISTNEYRSRRCDNLALAEPSKRPSRMLWGPSRRQEGHMVLL